VVAQHKEGPFLLGTQHAMIEPRNIGTDYMATQGAGQGGKLIIGQTPKRPCAQARRQENVHTFAATSIIQLLYSLAPPDIRKAFSGRSSGRIDQSSPPVLGAPIRLKLSLS
jgi:hypothetical protein